MAPRDGLRPGSGGLPGTARVPARGVLFGHSMDVPGSPGIGKTHQRMRLAEGLPSTFRACLHKTPLSVPRACFRQECVTLSTVCVSSQDASVCVLCLLPIGGSLSGTVSVCFHKTR